MSFSFNEDKAEKLRLDFLDRVQARAKQEGISYGENERKFSEQSSREAVDYLRKQAAKKSQAKPAPKPAPKKPTPKKPVSKKPVPKKK